MDTLYLLQPLILLLSSCGGAGMDGESTSSVEESMVSEPLPIAELAEEEGGGGAPAEEAPAEESEAPAEEAFEAHSSCVVEESHPAVVRQLRVFQRWLRDQSVGRHILVEGVNSGCGNRDGFFEATLILSGPAGGLQSLGRALPSYYPGASWNVVAYDRLEGQDVPLRVTVEIRIPVGAEPRPRCLWDGSITCDE